MTSIVPGLLLLAALPFALALLRDWPRLLCGVALASCALPFFLPLSAPFSRCFAAIFTCLFLVKSLQFSAGHVRPQGRFEFLLFLLSYVVVRWETPRRPDGRRAARTLFTGLFHLGLAWLLRDLVLRLDGHNPVQLFPTVARQHYKLWLASADVLRTIFSAASTRFIFRPRTLRRSSSTATSRRLSRVTLKAARTRETILANLGAKQEGPLAKASR